MHDDSSADSKLRGLLKTVSKIILRVFGAGLTRLFGFWLLLASYMTSDYLTSDYLTSDYLTSDYLTSDYVTDIRTGA